MGALTDYVTLTISRASVGLTRAGFGTVLILTPNVSWTERTRTYADISAVAADFSDTTSAEYLAANAIFEQSPAPTKIKFGRLSNKPTLVYQLSAITPTSNVSYTYSVNVKGKGVTPTTVTFTSDGTPTDAEYAAGMVTALNSVVGKNFTATGATSPISITATNPGDWFSIEVADPATQKVKMTHADPGVATDLAAILLADKDWYTVYNLFNSELMGGGIAAWVESNKKTYICDTNVTEAIITAAGNGDLLDDLKTLAYSRTLGFYHHAPDQFAGAALLGRCMPIDPGGETWALKTLVGVAASPLTGTHKTNLENRNANGYESIGSVGVTFDGKVASGDYFDVTRFLDWFENTAATYIFNALTAEDKTPFNDAGISKIGSQLRKALKEAVTAGGFNDDWEVILPKYTDVSSSNKTARTLSGVKFKATLAGAVQKVTINGNVTA